MAMVDPDEALVMASVRELVVGAIEYDRHERSVTGSVRPAREVADVYLESLED